MKMFSDSDDYKVFDPTEKYKRAIQEAADTEVNANVKAGLLKAIEIIDRTPISCW